MKKWFEAHSFLKMIFNINKKTYRAIICGTAIFNSVWTIAIRTSLLHLKNYCFKKIVQDISIFIQCYIVHLVLLEYKLCFDKAFYFEQHSLKETLLKVFRMSSIWFQERRRAVLYHSYSKLLFPKYKAFALVSAGEYAHKLISIP